MEIHLDVLGLVFGLTLAFVSSCAPSVKTVAWIFIAANPFHLSWLSAPDSAIVSFFICSQIIGGAAQIQGKADELGRQVNITACYLSKSEVLRFVIVKLCYLVLGLFMGSFIALCSWKGLGGAGTYVFLIAILMYRYKACSPALWILLVGVAACIYGFSLIGVTNGPLVLISTLNGVAYLNKHSRANRIPGLLERNESIYAAQLEESSASKLMHPQITLAAPLAGIVPGLNADIFLPNNFVGSWLAGATGEGISLAVLILQRTTSKTTVTTYLAQYGQGISGLTAILAIVLAIILSMSLLCAPLILEILKLKLDSPRILVQLLTIATSAYFISIPNQPFLSFFAALALFFGIMLLKNFAGLFSNLPQNWERTLAMAPIIFL